MNILLDPLFLSLEMPFFALMVLVVMLIERKRIRGGFDETKGGNNEG